MIPAPSTRHDPRVMRVREIGAYMDRIRKQILTLPERTKPELRARLFAALEKCGIACLAAKIGNEPASRQLFAEARSLNGSLNSIITLAMTLWPILVLATLPAEAADLPWRDCADVLGTPLCISDAAATPSPAPAYVGPLGSIPAADLAALTQAQQSACRVEADKVRAIAYWAHAAERNRRFGYAFERCARRALITGRSAMR